jgi:hypothetical protein
VLERLDISDCTKITDTGLDWLTQCCVFLDYLNLTGLSITPVALSKIASNCKQLKSLILKQCGYVTDESIALVTSQCQYLEHLNLDSCSQLSQQAAFSIAANCQNLKEIDFSFCRKVTASHLVPLVLNCKNIQTIHYWGHDPDTVQQLLSYKPHLRVSCI